MKRDWLGRAKAEATSLLLPDGGVITVATVCGEGHAVTIGANFRATNDDQYVAQALSEYKQVVETVRFAPRRADPTSTIEAPIVGTWSDNPGAGMEHLRSVMMFRSDGTVLSTVAGVDLR